MAACINQLQYVVTACDTVESGCNIVDIQLITAYCSLDFQLPSGYFILGTCVKPTGHGRLFLSGYRLDTILTYYRCATKL